MRIEVVRKVLERNEQAAQQNRQQLDEAGVTCINLLGGAGCGKTSLLEAVLPRLKDDLHVAVLEGDLATTRDAERIAVLHVPVVQLLTEGGCHLSAAQVQQGLHKASLDRLDLLVIENVGNPICPANFDLGEHLRVAVLSVAEGHDKPAKYPLLFKGASVVVISKCDLLEHTGFDLAEASRDIERINPKAAIIQTDIRSGQGIDRLVDWIRGNLGSWRCRTARRCRSANTNGT